MARRSICCLVLVCLVVTAVAADPHLVFRDDPLYERARRLALLAGSSGPAAVSPITRDELLLAVRRIDVDALPSRAIADYRALRRELEGRLDEDASDADSRGEAVGGEDSFQPTASVGIETTVEAYLHGGDEADWIYTYPDRRPVLSVPLRARPLTALAIEFDFDWRKNYPFYEAAGVETVNPDPLTNLPIDVRESDVQFPFHAVASLGGPRWSVQIGRTALSVGHASAASLVLSDHVEFHDFLMAGVFGDLASYRAIYVDLEPWIDTTLTADDRMFFLHRIELRPLSWLSLAANEGFIFEGKPIELRYFNPLMVMHSWFVPSYGNSILLFEAAVRPIRRLEAWAHVAIDQLQAGSELERAYTDSEPQALGWLAGFEYIVPLATGTLSVGSEWVYLDPWMYLGRTMLGSFTYRRRVQAENVVPDGAKVIVEKSLGYPDGPDFWEVMLFAGADLLDRYSIVAEVSYAVKGENNIGRYLPVADADDAGRVTPSGSTPEHRLAARIGGDALVWSACAGRALLELHAGAIVDVVHTRNDNREPDAALSDVQVSPYLSFSAGW